MAMKKIQDHRDSVNCLTLTKEGRLISAGSDKQIIIY
jgi:WD40 repeat protein